MRSSVIHDLSVLAFAGFLGIGGAAQARPADRDGHDNARPQVVQNDRVGTPPAGTLKAEARMHAALDGKDGRGDAADSADHRALPTWAGNKGDKPVDRGYTTDKAALPVKKDLAVRLGGGDNPEGAGGAAGLQPGRVTDNRTSRTYADVTAKAPPIQLKQDVTQKLIAGDDSDVKAEVRPTELRTASQTAQKTTAVQPLHANQLDRGNSLQNKLHTTVPTANMKGFFAGKAHHSAGGDAPGDKDAP